MDEQQKIEEGDVVDHKLFGLGKVQAVNDRGYSPSKSGAGNGYPVTVAWNDPNGRESSVMSWALKKVSSPEIRPFIFLDKQWQPLRDEWLKARREVELLCKTFDPAPDQLKLDEVIKAEAEAWERVKDFIATPRT